MASGPFQLYNRTLGDIANGALSWDSNNHVAILVDNYNFDPTDTTIADVSALEVTNGDYANQNVASETVFYNAAGNVSFDAGDVTFTNSGTVGPASHIVIALGSNAAVGNAGAIVPTSLLYGAMELEVGTNVSSTSGQFQIQWGANGLFTMDQTV